LLCEMNRAQANGLKMLAVRGRRLTMFRRNPAREIEDRIAATAQGFLPRDLSTGRINGKVARCCRSVPRAHQGVKPILEICAQRLTDPPVGTTHKNPQACELCGCWA
jgi:hypothetical protein